MTMTTEPRVLPYLLKAEGLEADLSHAQITQTLKYIDRRREWIYRSWLSKARTSVAAEQVAEDVDGLLTIALVLHYLRPRLPQLPGNVGELRSGQHSTIAELAESLRSKTPALLGSVLFSSRDFSSAEPVPEVVWMEDWEEQIGLAVRQLFDNQAPPTWFFGDFHQLCAVRPLAASETIARRRGSELRYSRGIHYTPAPVADFLVAETLKAFHPEGRKRTPVVLDPSCGTGNLLIAAFRYLCNAFELILARADRMSLSKLLDARLNLLCSSVCGQDIDANATAWTRRALVLEACEGCFAEVGNFSHRSEVLVGRLGQNVSTADFLQCPGQSRPYLGGSDVDFIVGGPPFVRLQQLTRTQPNRIGEYRRRYRSARAGQFDLYMLFVEESLNRLREGGRMGLSIANTFLRSASGRGLRELLGESATVTDLVEFEDSKLYPDAVTQILLLFADSSQREVPVRHVQIRGRGNVRSKLEDAFSERSVDNSAVIKAKLGCAACRGPDWDLYSPSASEWIEHLRAACQPLSKACCAVGNGWNTGADGVFILRRLDHAPGGDLVAVRHRRSKEEFHLESRLLRPIVHGRDVASFAPPRPMNIAIYPFDDAGIPLPEKQLADEAPRLWDYLLTCRHELETVKRQKSLPWYSPRSSVAGPFADVRLLGAMVTAGRNMTVARDPALIAHSSVLRVIPGNGLDPFLLLGILNSLVFWQYTRLTVPTMGLGRHVFRVGRVRTFPFPPPECWQTPRATALAELARTMHATTPGSATGEQWGELDVLAHALYGIDRCAEV